MNNFVISLAAASHRRAHIINEFSKKKIAFDFFDAITPDEIDTYALKFKINIHKSDLTRGEIACFFSHIVLWQQCIEKGLKHIAVFEDDVYLGKNIHLFLNNTAWINKEMELIKLEAFEKYADMANVEYPTLDKRVLKPLRSQHLGTCGYIISSAAATKILNNIIQSYTSIAISEPIDHLIFNRYLNNITALQLLPAIAIQSDRLTYLTNQLPTVTLNSDLQLLRNERLENEHQKYKEKHSLSIFSKIIREVTRPYHRYQQRRQNARNTINFY